MVVLSRAPVGDKKENHDYDNDSERRQADTRTKGHEGMRRGRPETREDKGATVGMEEVCRQDRHRTLLKGKTSNTRRAEDRLKNNESNRMDVGHFGD